MPRTFLEFLEEAGIAPDLIDFVRRVVDHPEDLYTLPPERQAYWENRIDQVLSMVDVSKEGPASLKGADPMKVQIADDHSKYRSSLRAALERHPEIEVIAESENGKMALDQAREHRPDVVLMDINMPVMDGIEATRQLVLLFPDLPVIMLSVHEDIEYRRMAFRVGASDYLSKDSNHEDILKAIHQFG
jgi:CheY-like chemotaxis protein